MVIPRRLCSACESLMLTRTANWQTSGHANEQNHYTASQLSKREWMQWLSEQVGEMIVGVHLNDHDLLCSLTITNDELAPRNVPRSLGGNEILHQSEDILSIDTNARGALKEKVILAAQPSACTIIRRSNWKTRPLLSRHACWRW